MIDRGHVRSSPYYTRIGPNDVDKEELTNNALALRRTNTHKEPMLKAKAKLTPAPASVGVTLLRSKCSGYLARVSPPFSPSGRSDEIDSTAPLPVTLR